MPIDRRKKILFLHIPRTAGTSIEKHLKIYGRNELHGEYKSVQKHTWKQHFTLAEIVQLGFLTEEDLDQYFKFVFVRNPFDKIVSEYFWRKEDSKISFNDFILNKLPRLLEDKSHNLYCHIRPQIDFISSYIVDFIGRFELFNLHFREILCRNKITFYKLKHENKTKNRKSYMCYYKKESIKMLENLYEKDLNIFGYEYGK